MTYSILNQLTVRNLIESSNFGDILQIYIYIQQSVFERNQTS